MCTFIFHFENNVEHIFEHIIRVQYFNGLTHNITENDLLTSSYPITGPIHLFSDNSSYTVNLNNISYIEVQKEN